MWKVCLQRSFTGCCPLVKNIQDEGCPITHSDISTKNLFQITQLPRLMIEQEQDSDILKVFKYARFYNKLYMKRWGKKKDKNRSIFLFTSCTTLKKRSWLYNYTPSALVKSYKRTMCIICRQNSDKHKMLKGGLCHIKRKTERTKLVEWKIRKGNLI